MIVHILCRFILVLKRVGLGLIPCYNGAKLFGTGTFISECFLFALPLSSFQCSEFFFVLIELMPEGQADNKATLLGISEAIRQKSSFTLLFILQKIKIS